MGVITVYCLLTVDDKFSCSDRLLPGLRATAGEQKYFLETVDDKFSVFTELQ